MNRTEALDWLRRLQNDRTTLLRWSDDARETLAEVVAVLEREDPMIAARAGLTLGRKLGRIEAEVTNDKITEAMDSLYSMGLGNSAPQPMTQDDADELAEWRAMFAAFAASAIPGQSKLFPNPWRQDVAFVAYCLHRLTFAKPPEAPSDDA